MISSSELGAYREIMRPASCAAPIYGKPSGARVAIHGKPSAPSALSSGGAAPIHGNPSASMPGHGSQLVQQYRQLRSVAPAATSCHKERALLAHLDA